MKDLTHQQVESVAQTGQTTAQKVATLGAGVGGISLKLVDIATIAQQIGMIVGAALVCGQFYIFIRDRLRERRRNRRPVNDR